MEISEPPVIEEKFEIRLDRAQPRIAFILVPIGKYAENLEDGMALLHGKLKETEARLSRILVEMRQRKIKVGVINPDGTPNMVA